MGFLEHSTVRDLAQAWVMSYAAGLNLYGTVVVLGIGQRFEWLQDFPATLSFCAGQWVIIAGGGLCCVEFLTTFLPGIARAWETVYSLVRPPGGAILAASTVWHRDPAVVLLAGLLGGLLAITT